MSAPSIYVEICIRGSMDDLWRLTQTPELHERWDARFSTIEYLPRVAPDEPQRFRYATRIGFGKLVEGGGESVGENHAGGVRTSALKFWSDDPKSLIREGSGYWKYVPVDDGVRFITRYDYRTRLSRLGAVIDRVAFRPLLGWATAWSFDRLRLWIEKGCDPASAMQRSVIHAVSRLTLAFLWLYQGIVPKLIFRDRSGELETVERAGLFAGYEAHVLTSAAVLEMVIGVAMIVLWRQRWLFLANIVLLVLLLVAAVVADATLYVMQFNPATLNVAMMALALAGWISSRDLPSASRCLRKPPEERS